MDTNLDQMDLLANQDNPEFEAFLDEWYEQREAEWAEMEMGKLEMMGRECGGNADDYQTRRD